MSHRGEPVQRPPRPPRKREFPIIPVLLISIGAVITALLIVVLTLYVPL